MGERQCTRCGESFSANEEYFYKVKRKNKKLGEHYVLSNWCKSCHI